MWERVIPYISEGVVLFIAYEYKNCVLLIRIGLKNISSPVELYIEWLRVIHSPFSGLWVLLELKEQ